VVVGKWETRSVFQGGAAPVFSAAFFPCHFARKLLRCPISQAAVRTPPIVLIPPSYHLLPDLEPIPEPAHPQAFVPQLAEKIFRLTVLHRPARLDMHQLDLALDASPPFPNPKSSSALGGFNGVGQNPAEIQTKQRRNRRNSERIAAFCAAARSSDFAVQAGAREARSRKECAAYLSESTNDSSRGHLFLEFPGPAYRALSLTPQSISDSGGA